MRFEIEVDEAQRSFVITAHHRGEGKILVSHARDVIPFDVLNSSKQASTLLKSAIEKVKVAVEREAAK